MSMAKERVGDESYFFILQLMQRHGKYCEIITTENATIVIVRRRSVILRFEEVCAIIFCFIQPAWQ